MAGSVNKAILIGNLGKDPEIKTGQDGRQIARFSIATNERWTDKATGEKRERVEWHNIVVFNENLVRVAEQFLRKGSLVHVEGQIATRKWTDQSGTERYSTEIVLKQFRGELTLLDSPGGRPAPSEDDYGTTRSREPAGAGGTPSARSMKDTAPGFDDEIPF